MADDAAGGFFALNGGSLGDDFRRMYYLPPDTLRWESMKIEFSQFVQWSMTGALSRYYEDLRWPGWQEDVKSLHGDRCFIWFPPLWVRPDGLRDRGEVPVEEAWNVAQDFRVQLGDA